MEQDNKNTKEYWNITYKEIGFYQDGTSKDWNIIHDFIERALPKSPQKILEIACGLAHNSHFAATLGHRIIATDFSEVAIAESKKRFADPNIRFDCLSLEEATENFREMDVIMGFEIIEHYKNPLIPLLKIFKSLKEGGIFIFSVPTESGFYGEYDMHYSLWNYDKLGERLFKVGFKEFKIFKTMFSNEDIMGVAYK